MNGMWQKPFRSLKTFLIHSLCVAEIQKREKYLCRSYDGQLWDTITIGIQRQVAAFLESRLKILLCVVLVSLTVAINTH
jgi:hypothetical protein